MRNLTRLSSGVFKPGTTSETAALVTVPEKQESEMTVMRTPFGSSVNMLRRSSSTIPC